MSITTEHNGRGVSQTVVAGTLNTPWLFTLLLVGNMFLLGVIYTKMEFQSQSQIHTDRELRLLQMQIQDQTAVMIREGIIKKGDQELGPTSPTNQGK